MTKLSSDVDSKLSNVVIEQLRRKHICTVIQFIDEDSEKLATFTGLLLKEIFEIKRNILKKYGGIVQNALHLFEMERNNIIPTNVSSLDNLLKGGLYPGQIYEICGISSSGKTQLCFTIAANIALKPDNFVQYIDTKRDFCGSRVEQILLKKNCSKQIINETMERINVCSVYNFHQLSEVLEWLTCNLKKDGEGCRTRIVIIDSLPAVVFKFSTDLKTRVVLNYIRNTCCCIANTFHVSVIIVNLITQWSTVSEEGTGTSSNKICYDVIPTLGQFWSHVPNTRLLLEKMGLGNRKLSIWKSFQLEANLACNLTISDSGILCS